MNILVFSWRDPMHPLAGGAEQVMHEHMKWWISSGHNVTLFSSRFPGSKEKENLEGVEIIRGGYQYLGVQVSAFFYYLKNKSKYEFLVDQFHGIPFFTPLYSTKPKLAVIQEVAKNVWLLNPLPKPINWIVGGIGYFFEPIIFLFYKNTAFMTGSLSAKKDVFKMGIPKKNIYIVPHGTKIIYPKPFPKKAKKLTVAFLGIHSKDKGIEDAIECFNLLKKNTSYQFWTIGKFETDEYEKEVKKKIKRLKLDERIKMFGFVSQKKKFELLAKAHLLINPSIHEGWGLVNIEANSMATPVIAYKSPGLIDSIKNNKSGLILNINSPIKMANTVNLVFSDRKLYKKLQKGSVNWSKKFSWKTSKKQSLKLIESLSNSH